MKKDFNSHLIAFEKQVRKKWRELQRWFKENKPQIRHYSRHVLLGITEAAGVLLGAVLVVFAFLWFSTPKAELKERPIPQTTVIYDRTGEHPLYEIHGEFNRKLISHAEIPNNLRKAVLATEDANFYSHFGVDLGAVIRAIKVNYEKGGVFQGASTITQQLARSAFLTRDRNWTRKILEMVLAVKIEAKYSKDEILDFYLNEVAFGSNSYGAESAAETYFGKSAKELDLGESAMLAALIKAPTYYSPYGNHLDELKLRQEGVIRRMGELNLLSLMEENKALGENVWSRIAPFRQAIEAPHFVFFVREWLEEKFGSEAVETGGMKVITTLDWEAQKKAEEMVRETALANEKRYRASNASLVALDPRNGEILAMVGSRDYFDPAVDGQVNVAIRERQPGSAFKPVIYARAFEKGYQPETLLYDVRTNFGPDGSGKDYIPKNYNGKFSGLVSMREALARSLNIPAVKTLYLVGLDDALGMAERLGITTLDRRDKYGLSLALGGGEINLLQLTQAFSVFATEGLKPEWRSVVRIEDEKGEVYGSKNYSPSQNVMDVQAARKINSILSDNQARSAIFGSASPLYIPGKTIAAKTGTTQDNRDGWTIGYTPSFAVGVWAGNNDNSMMRQGADGVYVAAPLWNRFVKWMFERYPNESFTAYEKVASDKPMIAGQGQMKALYFNKEKNKKISEKKAKKIDPANVEIRFETPDRHDLLYFINKNDPLGGGQTDPKDPMLIRWDEGVQNYLDSGKDKD